jgi:phosphate transport system substrate-binding protein
MSREMTNNEVNKFVKKYGYKPSRVSVGLDALEIFVNSKNPIQGLSLQQLDAIFSTTNKRGFKGNITVWGQVGLKSKWAFRKINLYGRNYSSGTNGYFKESTLLNGEYKPKIVLLPTSDEMIKSISADLFGIGYSGIGYNNSGVKSIPLAEKDGVKYYRGTYKNVLNDNYPLSRFLYIYFNKKHGIQLDKLTHEFLKFILSYEGQKIVVKAGYFPLPVKNVVKELKKLE